MMALYIVADSYFLATGSASAETNEEAYEAALRDAGIGDLNLTPSGFLLPPSIPEVTSLPPLTPGSFVPAVVSTSYSDVPGKIPCAAIGIAVPRNGIYPSVVMAKSGWYIELPEDEARAMANRALEARGCGVQEILSIGKHETVPETGKPTCAVAAVLLLGRNEG